MTSKITFLTCLLMLSVGFLPSGSAGAEENAPFSKPAETHSSELSTAAKTSGNSFAPPSVENYLAKLRELRANDPAEFRKQMKIREARLREKMQKLRSQDPEKFEEFSEKRRKTLRKKMRMLQEKDPERFREFASKRRAQFENRINDLKTRQPEQYERIMARRLRRVGELRERNPERFEQDLTHPLNEHLGTVSLLPVTKRLRVKAAGKAAPRPFSGVPEIDSAGWNGNGFAGQRNGRDEIQKPRENRSLKSEKARSQTASVRNRGAKGKR